MQLPLKDVERTTAAAAWGRNWLRGFDGGRVLPAKDHRHGHAAGRKPGMTQERGGSPWMRSRLPGYYARPSRAAAVARTLPNVGLGVGS
jgi:hypothetical protein